MMSQTPAAAKAVSLRAMNQGVVHATPSKPRSVNGYSTGTA